MTTIPLGLGDWGSLSENLPRFKLENMYLVSNPVSLDKLSRVSRPTLTSIMTVGAGPVYKMWNQSGLLNGDSLVVSGTTLYRVDVLSLTSTSLGSIPGTDIPDISGTLNTDGTTTVLIARNGVLYSTDGTTLSTVTVPDSQLVLALATINSFFLISIKNSQKFYWLEPSSLTIDPLNFASAERIPDPIQAIAVSGDEIWFLGLSGPEVWSPTGDLDAPFQRVNGRVYLDGCQSKDNVLVSSYQNIPALFWVTTEKTVVRAQGNPVKISNESVEELLRGTNTISAWLFRQNRHDFYVMSSGSFTLVYDIANDVWCRWVSSGMSNWRAQSGIQLRSSVYAGDKASNVIYQLVEGVTDGTDPVVRTVSGYVDGTIKPLQVKEINIYGSSGWSPSTDVAPVIKMRWSDDLGSTWSSYITGDLRTDGQNRFRVSFRSLGLIRELGRVFEIVVDSITRFRLDYATINERDG